MNGPARLVICGVLVLFAPGSARAQGAFQSTPPAVTADAEPWYRNREPVIFSGNSYYPAGARIHFISSEMVRSGTYQGVPLYSRTTIEPYSVVYVPLAGGLMEPYERRRDGQLAGTVGSSAPSFPVATSRDIPLVASDPQAMAQAPAPPMLESTGLFEPAARAAMLAAPVFPPQGPSAGPAHGPLLPGIHSTALAVVIAPPLMRRPDSANAVFVQFDGARWFSSGLPTTLDPARFTRIGEIRGFPVYTARGASASTIYVPVSRDMDAVAPYSARK
ncbi:MAG: hypothetical protein ABI603_06900 [Acidobacteriota bacterium]